MKRSVMCRIRVSTTCKGNSWVVCGRQNLCFSVTWDVVPHERLWVAEMWMGYKNIYFTGQIWFQVNFDVTLVDSQFFCPLALRDKGNWKSTWVKSKLTRNQIWPVTYTLFCTKKLIINVCSHTRCYTKGCFCHWKAACCRNTCFSFRILRRAMSY